MLVLPETIGHWMYSHSGTVSWKMVKMPFFTLTAAEAELKATAATVPRDALAQFAHDGVQGQIQMRRSVGRIASVRSLNFAHPIGA